MKVRAMATASSPATAALRISSFLSKGHLHGGREDAPSYGSFRTNASVAPTAPLVKCDPWLLLAYFGLDPPVLCLSLLYQYDV
jgi:hypothetical protein